jgi:acetyl esterase/lipase
LITDGSYLREWANKLDVPILSIDYRLAPRAPYPRAIEEVFFAYVWALNNLDFLGTSGKNILFVGDSAGGNLVTACMIKCIELGIRKPKGLFTCYSSYLINYMTNPSKYMGLIEVGLPYTLHMFMFTAYAGLFEKDENTKNVNRKVPKNCKRNYPALQKDYIMSPYYAPKDILSEFPRSVIVSTNIDSCLDDCVEFAKKLKQANVDVKLDVLEGVNHGFLNFSRVSLITNLS